MSTNSRSWYIIQTTTGREERVRSLILKAKEISTAGERVYQVLIPTEDVVQIQKNKKVVRKRKFFPGYVLIDMVVDSETYWMVRNINGVSGFLGGSNPVALPETEVQGILELTETTVGSRPKPAVTFDRGESVRINEGPFKHFVGVTEEVNEERARLKVMVTIFGRATPVELDFLQVEKV